jgi:hypothetical protein
MEAIIEAARGRVKPVIRRMGSGKAGFFLGLKGEGH